MKSCNKSTENIFEEAINHCRWKKSLQTIICRINMADYKNKTFEQILLEIDNICCGVKGVGKLSTYDITSAICRYHGINIDKVYIIGNGPKRAVKLLNIKVKKQKVNNKINLNYVEIIDVINAFDANNCGINENIRYTKNGDILETYICNWQKTK